MRNYYNQNKHCECGELINNKAIRCRSCEGKRRHKEGIVNGKGMYGKHHTKESKQKIRESRKGKYGGEKAPGYKDGRYSKTYYCKEEECNNIISYATWKYGKGRCKYCASKLSLHGKRFWYRNTCFRSSWEAKFAQFLDLSGIEWEYESERFYFKDCSYLPDFYIPAWVLYVEIKGYWRKNTKKRFELFKKNYPNENIKLLMQPELEELGVL